jgi:hypothetical protein
MAEPFRVQVAMDESARDRLRQMAGQGPATVAFMLNRLIETGLAEKKRLMAGIVRRLELAQRGALTESDRAGVVQVPVPPKLGLQLAELGAALDLSAGGMAGLIVKVVLADEAWTMSVFTTTIADIGRPK